MIRLYEYEPRIDEEGNATEACRDFQNYLFSHPYGFIWDFSADKVVIYGIAYRISSLRRIPDGNQVTCLCLCGGNSGESSGSGAIGTVISKIKTDESLHGEGSEDNPLGVQLSQKIGNRLQILDDGCYVGDDPVPYNQPSVVLSSSIEPGGYLKGETFANVKLSVAVAVGSEKVRDVRILEGKKTLHVFELAAGLQTYTFNYAKGIDSDTTFTASISDGMEYLSNTLTYKFDLPAFCGVSENETVTAAEILAGTVINISGNSFKYIYDTDGENGNWIWMCCPENRIIASMIGEKGAEVISLFQKSPIKLTLAGEQFNYSLYEYIERTTMKNIEIIFNF